MASQFPIQVMGNYAPDRIRYMPVKAAETFIVGALVKTTSAEAQECGADPALITGIALASAATGLASVGSFFGDPLGVKMIPVFMLTTQDTCFIASSTTPVYATHFNQLYGVEKTTNWRLDISETSATRCLVVGVSLTPQQEGFYVRFIAANLEMDAVAS